MTTVVPTTAAHCGAKTRAGTTCKRPAGWGTNHAGTGRPGHVGTGRCKLHGGATPRGEVAGVVQLARRDYAVMGAPIDGLRADEALLECIRIAGGEVAYASERIAELEPEETVGPTVSTRPLKGVGGAESPIERAEDHGPPALHIWIEVRHKAMDRLVNYSKVAIAAGLEERRVRVAEAQGQMLAEVIRGILTELGQDTNPKAPAVVRKHLTLMAGNARELVT